MAKEDLLEGITNDIPLKKDPFCDGMQSNFEEGVNALEDSVSVGKNNFEAMRAKFDEFFAKHKPPWNTDSKVSALSKLKDIINSGLTMNIGECESLLDCVGTSSEDLFGFDKNKLLKDPDVNFGKYPSIVSDQLKGFVDDTIGSVLDESEKGALDQIKELEGLVDVDDLDDLLALAGCIGGHCDSSGYDIPPELDVESKLEEAGLKITGDVDLGQAGLEKSQQDHFSALKDARKELDSAVNDKISKIF